MINGHIILILLKSVNLIIRFIHNLSGIIINFLKIKDINRFYLDLNFSKNAIVLLSTNYKDITEENTSRCSRIHKISQPGSLGSLPEIINPAEFNIYYEKLESNNFMVYLLGINAMIKYAKQKDYNLFVNTATIEQILALHTEKVRENAFTETFLEFYYYITLTDMTDQLFKPLQMNSLLIILGNIVKEPENKEVIGKVINIYGNMILNSSYFIYYALDHDIIRKIFDLIQQKQYHALRSDFTILCGSILNNFQTINQVIIENDIYTDIQLFDQCIEYIKSSLFHKKSEYNRKAIKAISQLTYYQNEFIIDSFFIDKCIECYLSILNEPHSELVLDAVTILFNYSGNQNNTYCRTLVESGVLNYKVYYDSSSEDKKSQQLFSEILKKLISFLYNLIISVKKSYNAIINSNLLASIISHIEMFEYIHKKLIIYSLTKIIKTKEFEYISSIFNNFPFIIDMCVDILEAGCNHKVQSRILKSFIVLLEFSQEEPVKDIFQRFNSEEIFNRIMAIEHETIAFSCHDLMNQFVCGISGLHEE